MTLDKVKAVLRGYSGALQEGFLCVPLQLPPDEMDSTLAVIGDSVRMDHVVWMCEEVQGWGPERTEKAMRWLGFVQGVLWAGGWASLDQLKADSRPEPTMQEEVA